jgi:hypothetical protein
MVLVERRYSFYSFLTAALERGEGQHQVFTVLYLSGKDPQYPLYRRLVGPRASLHAQARGKIFCLCQGSNPGYPVHSQMLY